MSILVEGKEERTVAKRVYRISDADESDESANVVSLAQNRAFLEAECARLLLGEKFFTDFLVYAKEMAVPVYQRPSCLCSRYCTD